MNKPLTFTAEEPNSTIKLSKYGSPTIDGLQYRLNEHNNWNHYNVGTEIELKNVGDYVQFQNTKNELSTSYHSYVYFIMSGKIAASGNIQSMLNYSNSCTPYCFYGMFDGCISLTKAPELPATTLAKLCYQYMFYDCKNLTKAPELSAIILAIGCYLEMFTGCINLKNKPKIDYLIEKIVYIS